jgi:hypothetical protein
MAKIILFEHDNYDGQALVIVQDTERLDVYQADVGEDGNWDNVVSSIIVISGEWTLYRDARFEGTRWFATAGGGPEKDGCYPSAQYWLSAFDGRPGENDQVSSLKIGLDTYQR